MQQAEKKGLIKHGVRNGFLIGFTLSFALALFALLDGDAMSWERLLLSPLFNGAIGAGIGLVVEVVINHQRIHAPFRDEEQEESYEELQEEQKPESFNL